MAPTSPQRRRGRWARVCMTRQASRCTAFRSAENLGVEGGILGGRQVRSMGEGRSGIFVTVDTCLGSRGAQSCALLWISWECHVPLREKTCQCRKMQPLREASRPTVLLLTSPPPSSCFPDLSLSFSRLCLSLASWPRPSCLASLSTREQNTN